MFLNRAMGFLLGGGAYAHSMSLGEENGVISNWLPLCNTGVRRVADQGASAATPSGQMPNSCRKL